RLTRLEETVQRLIEAQAQFEQRLTRLEEIVQRLIEAQALTEQRLARLEEIVQRLVEAQIQMQKRLDEVQNHLNLLRGWQLEERYRAQPHRFRRLVANPHVLEPAERARLVEEAEETGRLSPEEADDLGATDLIVRGRMPQGRGRVYLAVEVSITVNTDDVERAAARALLLERALARGRRRPTVRAAVAGLRMHPLAAERARALGVWWLRDGQVVPPERIPLPALPPEP
ncbi:MAG: hypothetical protein C4313_03750, partial [Thermoflexus sp.]